MQLNITPNSHTTSHLRIYQVEPGNELETIDPRKKLFIVRATHHHFHHLTFVDTKVCKTLIDHAENTLNLLFQAQKHPQSAPEGPIEVQMKDSTPSHSRQSSLHSFWSLPTRPASRPTSSHLSQQQPLATPPLHDISCSSCDTPLLNQEGDAMDIDADVEAGFSDFNCSQCHKPFCHNCSISNLGTQRHCLRCAGRKRWVGGLGWVTA